jgi:hypothetical protein
MLAADYFEWYQDRKPIMTDREMLELAAKAAGIDYYTRAQSGGMLTDNGEWNPLDYNGAALRLAAMRKIFRCHMDLFHKFYEEEIANGLDEPAATRRAIVRAVAEIGRNKS